MARKDGIDHGLFQRDGVWWIRWTRPSRHDDQEKIGPTKFPAKAFYQPDALVSGGLGLIGSEKLQVSE